MSLSADRELRRLDVLSGALNLGVLSLGPTSELEFASTTALELLGCPGEEVLRRRWRELKPLLAPDDAPDDPSGAPQCRVAEIRADGVVRSLRLECHWRGAACPGWLVLVKDRRAVDALEPELLLASQMRSQAYVHRVLAHDLKSPLNSMQLSLELLADALAEEGGAKPSSRERAQRHIGILREELARLNRLLQSVLEAREPLGVTAGELDLRELAREIARLLAPQARRQRVELDARLPASPVRAFGFPERIRQALLNAAIVALEPMGEGGRLSLELASRDNASSFIVTATDGKLPHRVLDGLYRAHYPGAADPRLYAARLTVESHGGELAVEALSGDAVRLVITLPPSGDGRL